MSEISMASLLLKAYWCRAIWTGRYIYWYFVGLWGNWMERMVSKILKRIIHHALRLCKIMHFWYIAVKILEKFPMLPFHCALTYVSFWDSFNFRKTCGNISNSGTKKYWEILFCCTQSSLSIGFTTHEIFPSTCIPKNVRVKMAGLIVN